MKKTLSTALVASIIALVPAGTALADPPNTLINVPAHRHFLVTPKGDWVPIGPDICDDPDLQSAFNQFHYNVHRSADNPFTPRDTLGPQNGAPGLHDGVGADLAVLGGCG